MLDSIKLTLIILFIFYIPLKIESKQFDLCQLQKYSRRRIKNGNYWNILSYSADALITTARLNHFTGLNEYGPCLRDEIYQVNYSVGCTFCLTHESIIIETLQSYNINTIKLRLWDYTLRIYDFSVYISNNNNVETKVYDDTIEVGKMIKIKFSASQINRIRFYCNNPNNENPTLAFVKTMAYFSF